MFYFDLRPEKYDVITGLLENLLSEAMYQMICFRFCLRIQRILHPIIPRKVIAFFEETFFIGGITFLYLLDVCFFLLLFKAKPRLDASLTYVSEKLTVLCICFY